MFVVIKLNAKQLNIVAWSLSVSVLVVAVIAWGQGNKWHIDSSYLLFPIFGLSAFSLMWSHYMVAAKRLYMGVDKRALHTYFEVTSLAVLALILLHPGLLAWQLWRDGYGLPPGSELKYVAMALKSSVILGMTAWLIFLAYELRRKYVSRPWWKYFQYASDAAMILIFIHALRLGGQLRHGWFRGVWYFYGVTLVISLVYIHTKKMNGLLQK